MILLLHEDRIWRELLRQEGVSFSAGINLDGVAVVVPTRAIAVPHAQRIWQFIESGGTILAARAQVGAVWPARTPVRAELRWLAADDDSPLFRNVGIVDVETEGRLMPDAGVGLTDSGMKAIRAIPRGRGFCILLPFDVAEVLSRYAAEPRQFPAELSRSPYDTVACVNRGEVRRLVANSLRLLLAFNGLPYVHLAYSPGAEQSAFGFRVDTDFTSRRDIETTAQLADRVGMKFTWFVNTGEHTEHLDLLAELARHGHDVQLHCQRHIAYPDYESNLDNYKLGKQTLTVAGITPVGVAAPYGEWNEALNRAWEKLGFEYSSEFCLAYDELPFRPAVGKGLSRVLQVPVHPICLGRLVAARATPEQMKAYLKGIIDRQAARREPCFLYDHPDRIAQFSEVLADVLAYGKKRCGTTITMSDYARWWQRRERFSWSATVQGGNLEIEADTDDEQLSIVVEQGERQAVVPASRGTYALRTLNWQPLPQPVPYNPRSVTARKSSLRMNLGSALRRVGKGRQSRRR